MFLNFIILINYFQDLSLSEQHNEDSGWWSRGRLLWTYTDRLVCRKSVCKQGRVCLMFCLMLYVSLPHIFLSPDVDSYIKPGSSISFKIWGNLAAESRNLYHIFVLQRFWADFQLKKLKMELFVLGLVIVIQFVNLLHFRLVK